MVAPLLYRREENLIENLSPRRNELKKKRERCSTTRSNRPATGNKKKKGEGYRSNEWLTYVGLAQRDLLPKDNNDRGRAATLLRRSFRAWRRYFRRWLWSSRRIAGARMTRVSRPAGATVSNTMSRHRGNTENHGQIPSAAPVRGIQYLSIVFGVLGEPHELCVGIGGERDIQVYIAAIKSWYTALLVQGYAKRRSHK